MKTRILLIGAAVFGWAVCAQATTMTYNAATDFSATSNPNDVWSYGYASDSVGPAGFTLYPVHEVPSWATDLDMWDKASGTWDPGVSHNRTSAPVIYWPAHAIVLNGASGYGSYVRWTAPANGSLSVDVVFTGIEATSCAAYVFENVGGVLSSPWSGTVGNGGTGSWSTGSSPLQVAAGDVIDFAVTAGGHTQLGASLTLTTVPEPAALGLLATGIVSLLAYAWRRRR